MKIVAAIIQAWNLVNNIKCVMISKNDNKDPKALFILQNHKPSSIFI